MVFDETKGAWVFYLFGMSQVLSRDEFWSVYVVGFAHFAHSLLVLGVGVGIEWVG